MKTKPTVLLLAVVCFLLWSPIIDKKNSPDLSLGNIETYGITDSVLH